jgi:phosphoglucosamine mutase
MARLFGADGIRGTIDVPPLTPEGIDLLGRSLGDWLKELQSQPVILVGTDTRESCQRMKEAIVDSLNRAGVATVDVGVLPTAGISYLLASKGFFSGGLVISASHLPNDENGIKVFAPDGTKIDDATEARIEADFLSGRKRPVSLVRARNVQEPDYTRQYGRDLALEFRHLDWRFVNFLCDCANGACSEVAPRTFQYLGVRPTLLNAWPDGANINQEAGSEHVRKNPGQMVAELQRYNLPYGIALDGDGDRVAIVDAGGHFYDGDELLAMLALKLQRIGWLNRERVVITPMSNSGLIEYLGQRQIQVEQVPNGDKYLTRALLIDDLNLGGEQIGHLVVRTHPARLTGDGLRTALCILAELAAHPGLQLTDLAPGLQKWPQINVNLELECRTHELKERIPGLVDKIAELEQRHPDLAVRACRPASTEAAYRIMLEARQTPVPVLAGCAAEMAALIQCHLHCQGELTYFDLQNGGMHRL